LISLVADYTKEKADFEKKLTVKFHDVNPRDATDIFDIEISLLGLLTAIREFHKISYAHVTSKQPHGINITNH